MVETELIRRQSPDWLLSSQTPQEIRRDWVGGTRKAALRTRKAARFFAEDERMEDSGRLSMGMIVSFPREDSHSHKLTGDVSDARFQLEGVNIRDPWSILAAIELLESQLDLLTGDKDKVRLIVEQPGILGAIQIYKTEIRRIAEQRVPQIQSTQAAD